jgi:N-acyl-D-amino-acid deacylase
MNLKRRLAFACLAAVITLLFIAAWSIFAPYRDIDILIVNGTVVDGTGGPPRVCDIAIREGKIIGIGGWEFLLSRPKLRIDAKNKIVAPGFIDVHTHVETNLPRSGPFCPGNFLRQGVTTLITGNCGRSYTDVQALFKNLERYGSYINLGTLVGHNSIRKEVMGTAAREATLGELNRMKALVNEAMENGALGISTGLTYVPGRFATTHEIVVLAKAAASHGGLYVTHVRDEGRNGIQALREALEVSRLSGARVHISHFKSSGPTQWNTSLLRLQLLDGARNNGQPVTIDAYPYDRSSTTTDILLPDWAVKEDRSGLRLIVQNKSLRKRLHRDIVSKLKKDGWEDLSHIRIVSGRPEWVGHTLAEVPIAAPDKDTQIENLIRVSVSGGAQAIYGDMNERDVANTIKYNYCVFGSDSAVRDPDIVYRPHPRGFGTFPRIFRRYVRETGLLQLNEAVNKASWKAAEIFGLDNRGALQLGAWADVVIFDIETIEDIADYRDPFAEPSGMDYVIVNGVVAVDHGNLTNDKPNGMILRRSYGQYNR